MVKAPYLWEGIIGRNPPGGSDGAMDLIDFAIFPHLESEMLPENTMTNAEKWAAGIQGPAYAIDDKTAIKVVDGSIEVISESRWRLFSS